MIRDRFYQEIIQRLSGRLDPELFEQCAADLLRKVYPSIVPVPGGTDAGMDGAICDGEGLSFPLVCTTQKDAIGNLTKSLNSYLRNCGSRRKAILATSRSLTPRKRHNLEIRASELGFELIQLYSQEAIANLLYESPKWCRELLNLIGQLPALSGFPKNSRPNIVEKLIGRESDLEWLERADGDLLLIGQPGSGKTFLLQKYAEYANGLFVIDSSIERISESIRSLNPKAIIVDDAHINLVLLKDLQQLRTQMGAKFTLIASCWPGYKDILIQALQIPMNLTHDLPLLNRDQIVELIKATGIKGPNDLIRELVNQTEGRPGLAATLCHLCLTGDIRQIVTGEILSREIRTTFEPLVGKESTQILAAFSLGGDAGMSMNAVAAHLGLRLTQIQQVVTGLAIGGILSDIGQNYLSVRPPMLRFALIREIFFCGASSMPYEKLIEESPSMVQTALTLIGAKSRDTQIPIDSLTKIVEQVNSDKVWNAFSYLGPEECNWIFENHPEELSDICEAGLFYIPQKIIPSLLSRAIEDKRPLHSNPDHPLRKIEDWVKSAPPGDTQTLMRREVLLNSTLAWFSKSNNIPITLKAICISLSPSFSDNETDPGRGMTVTIWSGLLTEKELEAIQNFWQKVLVHDHDESD